MLKLGYRRRWGQSFNSGKSRRPLTVPIGQSLGGCRMPASCSQPGAVWPAVHIRGAGHLAFASISARLQSETERSLADESGGPLAQLIPVPEDG